VEEGILKHALTAPLDGWVTEDVDMTDLQEVTALQAV
jgi:hypothetical protein